MSVSCTSNKSSIDKYSWYLLVKQKFRCHPGCQKYKATHRILIHATLGVLLWAKHHMKLFDNYLFKLSNPLDGASPVGSVVKNPSANAGDRLNSWVGKVPWRRKWQPTPVFLPGKSRGQRSLVGYSPWAHKEVRLSI